MMFCRKCGSQLEDGTVVCNVCGENQTVDTQAADGYYSQTQNYEQMEGQEQMVNQEQMYYQGNEMMQPKKSKKPMIIGIAVGAVALVALIVVGIMFIFGGGAAGMSADGITKKFLDAYQDMDGKEMSECLAYSNKYKEEMKDMEEELVETFDALKDTAKEMDMSLSYKMGKIKKVSGDDLDEFWKNAEDNNVLVEKKDVKDLSVCKATVIAKIKGMENEEEITLYVGKYDGKWKVIYME